MKELPEQLARIKIDKQLNESGCLASYRLLNYIL